MGLLALAIAPGIAICIFIYLKDKYNREPLGTLLISFLLGMFAIIPALLLQLLSHTSLESLAGESFTAVAIFAYLVVGVSEEGSKYVMLRLFAYRRASFDEPFDGIVYAVMVGMGFATLENIGYVLEHGMGTGIMRMFLSVPAHASFAVLMGYHLGLAKFDPANRPKYLFLAIFWPVVFHGTYDYFLFLGSTLMHVAGALVSFFVALQLSRIAIRKHQALSRQTYDKV
jgi:RsiW-degrading membrane proteinase PrsW (M82 family)